MVRVAKVLPVDHGGGGEGGELPRELHDAALQSLNGVPAAPGSAEHAMPKKGKRSETCTASFGRLQQCSLPRRSLSREGDGMRAAVRTRFKCAIRSSAVLLWNCGGGEMPFAHEGGGGLRAPEDLRCSQAAFMHSEQLCAVAGEERQLLSAVVCTSTSTCAES
eukprot:TRINITY_DN32150_c0_g1_i1.p1 TRINITY_DN32150_c0_g1~~TRINITY_DN32150_c0_g1_i1.p1  ORF type:complete len:163 (-),score=22.05 TRINITY_DN32150_c0_g1_i1:494-982(-)